MKQEVYLLPRADFSWFCLGVCGTAFLLKLMFGLQGSHSFLLTLSLFLFFLYTFLPKTLPPKIDRKVFLSLLASILFLLFANLHSGPRVKKVHPLFRSYLESQIKQSPLSIFESRIVMGFVTGSTKEIPGSFKDLSKESGILHLFAASGLHLGIFIGSLQYFGNLCFRKRKWISILISLGVGFLYLFALDFPVSFLRAYLFVFLSLTASLFFRKIGPADLLVISSAYIAFFLFYDFLSIGFLLSFGAVFGIFFLKPSLDQILLPQSKSLIKENLHLTIACSLCSFPVLVYYFRSFSFGGIWINFLLVPLAGILLPTIYFTIFLQSLVPEFLLDQLSSWIWIPASFELSLFLKIFHLLGNLGRGYKTWANVPFEFCFISVFLSFVLFLYPKISFRQSPFLKNPLYLLPILFLSISYFFPVPDLPFLQIKRRKGNLSIRQGDHLYLFGNCYNKKWSEPNPGLPPPQKISFESESCLTHIFSLIRKHNITDVYWYGIKNPMEWISKFQLPIKPIKTEILGANMNPLYSIIRFDGNPKEVERFLKQMKLADRSRSNPHWKGILLLDFPPWKKKEAKEWIQYQKLLGISTAWKMILVEETFEIPLLDHIQNPNLL
ncbi:ComEC/Rec2 family competence protein [Leptospira sp. 2 VSF19]|uniref:ComEC/Rec2 family competence protein n=1 Tax=Leptospira soteropolitanensis TaxID=2950025 RepID=A0AAW5VSZ4_9LEPT|nr:ComEC/Rec2 family competence protein [Leptospira soteropolitanensis]MCW7494458.1 ComEC/Rec2 family competence protein [Leptospira soteropolitanensis]MCW7502052.1 ComEC/Rec2 family competence protein [Leptospira soteropolitanensis]MCW7524304.1 ComEC/Rec2 family competence protein [Leptospira soteropolitanensis]MCW7528169.1 ComEC/Rec2 family competence protein [Leptospira soteropolitanensis]MCW7532022.1 ComEC/Rec2 family competence protein [Leptospira soteropolitanensis]